MAAFVAGLCGISLAVSCGAAPEVARGQEGCSVASGVECEEVGLLQRSSAQMMHGPSIAHKSFPTSLQFMQWNVGHPSKPEPQSHAFVNSQLTDGSLDFFNVINLEGLNLAQPYLKVEHSCSQDAKTADLVSLIYNSDRWVLQQEDGFCLSTGKPTGKDAAIVARFKPASGGPKLEVAGAHFAMFTPSAECAHLKQHLQRPDGYDVVFLGDTNAFELTTNTHLAKGWGIDVGASTPTGASTTLSPIFVPGWNADRIVTSLPGPTTPVTIVNVREKVQPTPFGMHKPIRVALTTSTSTQE